MKRIFYSVIIILIVFIYNSGYSLSQFIPKNNALYMDLDISDLGTKIQSIGNKLVGESFGFLFGSFKDNIKRDLGFDITNPSDLKEMGVDIDKRLGLAIQSFGNQPDFLIGIPVTNPKILRSKIIGLYKTKYTENKERITYHQNYAINIIQKKNFNGKYIDDLIITAAGGYILISNKFKSVKSAINHYHSGNNLAKDSNFIKVSRALNHKDQFLFITASEDLFVFINKLSSIFMGFGRNKNNKQIDAIKGFYKIISAGISASENGISIKGCTVVNKNHKLYHLTKKTFNPKSNNIDLFHYLPGKTPYLLLKANIDIQSYIKLFDKMLSKVMKQNIKKELNRELEKSKDISKEDLKKILSNLGYRYNLIVYDIDEINDNSNPDKFLSKSDIIAYAEFKNNYILENNIQTIINTLKNKTASEDVHVKTVYISNNKFYQFYNSKTNNSLIYLGAYKKYLIIATNKDTLTTLLDNVANNRKSFSDYLSQINLDKYINNKYPYNFYLNVENFISNNKLKLDQEIIMFVRNFKDVFLFGYNEENTYYSTFEIRFK